jgi:nucleoside-diphosphate-sugar epimerase
MATHVILGAGGVIANGLARELINRQIRPRLVSRTMHDMTGAEWLAADLTAADQTREAVRGAAVVFLCAGLTYRYQVWREQWPRIMDHTIAACREEKAKLIFFDNVYMYGKVDGPMTEDHPYNPCSRKGDLRARLATQLMSEVRKGNICALIARAADFYGPAANQTSLMNLLVIANLAKGKKAQWLVNASAVHSFTYTDDAVRSLVILAEDESAWNQVWHLPTASPPLTGKEYAALAAAALGKANRLTVLPSGILAMAGLFDRTLRELQEMLYQYRYDYVFDSSKFEKAYQYTPVPYKQGIEETAASFR